MKITTRRAIESQFAIATLIAMELPVKTSMEIASVACAIDKQVEAFAKFRDAQIKVYRIKSGPGDKPGHISYTSLIAEGDTEEATKAKEQALELFIAKMNEAVELEGEDIQTKIHLPETIQIKPELLKPLLPFIEVR